MKNGSRVSNFKEALEYIYSFIPTETQKLYPGDFGLKRTKYLLSLLDVPQDKIKSIHIAGTSGKGSTAYLTSVLLKSHGFKVGLILKPHILDIRERYQIDNKLISKKDFVYFVNQIIPAIEKTDASPYGLPTYAEVNCALAFLIFAKKKVDYMVIETYLGGLYDCTNVITRLDKVVIITKLGFDHTKILGNTLTKIAKQKAGIIHTNNQVFSISQKLSAENAIQEKAYESNALLSFIKPKENYSSIEICDDGIMFDFTYKEVSIKNLFVSLFGRYQAENTTLAITAVLYVSQRDSFIFLESEIRSALKSIHFPGRADVLSIGSKKVILDGAHNPQKMKAFLDSLKAVYPDRKFTFLVAFMMGKDMKKMIKLLTPLAENIIATSFFVENQDWIRKSHEPKNILSALNEIQYHKVKVIKEKEKALSEALKDTKDILIITGSLYLVSVMYPLFK